MRTVSPFRAALVVVAALTTASSAPAGAMYLQPDLVQIPAERLIANLERELDAAAPGSADRVRLELALGRLEAAAWARRSELITVRSPLTVTIDKPEVLTGVVDPDAIRGELGRLGGRGGTVVQGLLQATPEDAAAGCDLAKVMARYDYVGDVVLELMLRAQEGEERGTLPAAKVVVVSQTVGEDAVAACLAERVRRLGMPPVDRATTARVRFTFAQAPASPLTPFYGFGDSHVPARVDAGQAADEAAKKHLAAARSHYYAALVADPENALAHLGLAWTLEQLGLRDEAITCYRKTFKVAWKHEKDIEMLGLGQTPIAAEAAGYLLNLLDADRDAAERGRLEAAIDKLRRLPRPVTPIVVPLGASDALADLVDPGAGVPFDLDGRGLARRWGWIRPGAAWLVWDEGDTGEVRSGLQLFGSVSFWAFWDDGYQALRALDDDGDGVLRGRELRGLALWEDADGDGVSGPGEVTPVAARGVVALSTRAEPDASGVLSSAAGVVFEDGRTRPTWDWVSPGTAR